MLDQSVVARFFFAFSAERERHFFPLPLLRSRSEHDDSSCATPYAWRFAAFSSRSRLSSLPSAPLSPPLVPILLSPVFPQNGGAPMARSLSCSQGLNWNRKIAGAVYRVHVHVCPCWCSMRASVCNDVSLDRASGKTCVRHCVAGHARKHVYTHVHARARSHSQPKDSKRQMLKRPMETGHVDVAADMTRRHRT